ncbi:hypothetical protein, partial [Paralimibaculum aggregatum]|uniref:hypothetical protein n=1 Tax=Paralimibaculum aggregatum TaxID=3036245 RepID=UPI0025553457
MGAAPDHSEIFDSDMIVSHDAIGTGQVSVSTGDSGGFLVTGDNGMSRANPVSGTGTSRFAMGTIPLAPALRLCTVRPTGLAGPAQAEIVSVAFAFQAVPPPAGPALLRAGSGGPAPTRR